MHFAAIQNCVIYCFGKITQQGLFCAVVSDLLHDDSIFSDLVADGIGGACGPELDLPSLRSNGNICLSIAQISIGLFAKSQGLVADGIHSLSDLVADFVVLFASHHSKKDADDDHHYGHQRFENAASLILGLLLLLVGVANTEMGHANMDLT